MSFCQLPDDLLPSVLSFVPFEDVGNSILACRNFYCATDADRRRAFHLMIFLTKMNCLNPWENRRGPRFLTKYKQNMILSLANKLAIRTGGVKSVASAITRCLLKDCNHIDLSKNTLEDNDITLLFQSIHRSHGLPKLEVLNLSGNKITSQGWNTIADVIRQKSLPSLYCIIWLDNLEQPTTALKEICRSNRPYIRLTGLQ